MMQSELHRPILWNPDSDVHRGSTFTDNVTLTLYNMTLTSQKTNQYNNKFDPFNGYNIPQVAINKINVGFFQ